MKAAKLSKGKSASATLSSTMISPGASGVSATKPLGPCQVGDSVIFVASYPQAKSVQIAGDFNNWQPEKNPMRKTEDNAWHARIPLVKGVYHYRFVVDGHWQQDPYNEATEPNPYGGMNSVLKVE
jgi:1,4-alpha-glucan branching enzyme